MSGSQGASLARSGSARSTVWGTWTPWGRRWPRPGPRHGFRVYDGPSPPQRAAEAPRTAGRWGTIPLPLQPERKHRHHTAYAFFTVACIRYGGDRIGCTADAVCRIHALLDLRREGSPEIARIARATGEEKKTSQKCKMKVHRYL